MSRKVFATTNLAIWSDPDFRDLPPLAQWLYWTLSSSAGLSYAAVHDWRPKRLATRANGLTEDAIIALHNCLVANHFLVTDMDTEETLIRSHTRFTGVMKQPRISQSFITAYHAIASPTLQAVAVHELKKVQKESPEFPCWGDSRVKDVLKQPAQNAKDLPVPVDPFKEPLWQDSWQSLWQGFRQGFPQGFCQDSWQALAKTFASATVSVTVTTTVTEDLPLTVEAAKTPPSPAQRKTTLPETWTPTEAHAAIAASLGLNLEKQADLFRDSALTHARKYADWNAAFRNWLKRETQYHPTSAEAPTKKLIKATEYKTRADFETDEEYHAWLGGAR